jgi:hypothetical protein
MSNKSNSKGMNAIILFIAVLISNIIFSVISIYNLPTIAKLLISFIVIYLSYDVLEYAYYSFVNKNGKNS